MGALVLAAATLVQPADTGAERTWLRRLDARAKIVGLLGFIVAATLSRSLPALGVCVLTAWVLAGAGGVDWRRFALAVLSVPAFTLAIAAPATLNVVTGGRDILVLWHMGLGHWGPWSWPEVLAVTDRGLFVAGRFVLRSLACVSLGAILAASTRPTDLFRGLRGLGVPAVFVTVLDMMVRYLGLLLRGAEEIHLAKLSRSIGHVPVRREQAWAAAGMAELYRKCRRLSGEVADAMVSRGFSGEVRSLSTGRWGWPETVFVLACAAGATTALALGWGG